MQGNCSLVLTARPYAADVSIAQVEELELQVQLLLDEEMHAIISSTAGESLLWRTSKSRSRVVTNSFLFISSSSFVGIE